VDGVANNGAVARERGAEIGGERAGASGGRGGGVGTLGWGRVMLEWAFEGGGKSNLFCFLGRLGSAVFVS
jgi:hypothetical protein